MHWQVCYPFANHLRTRKDFALGRSRATSPVSAEGVCIASATLAPFPLFDWPPVCLRALGPLASLPSSDDTRTLCSSSLFFGFRRNFKENSFFRFFFFARPFFALLYHGACVVGNWLGPSELGWRSLLCREEACRQCSTSRTTAACSTAEHRRCSLRARDRLHVLCQLCFAPHHPECVA